MVTFPNLFKGTTPSDIATDTWIIYGIEHSRR